MKTKTVNVIYRVEPHLAIALRAVAAAQGYSLSELLRVLSRAYIESLGVSLK